VDLNLLKSLSTKNDTKILLCVVDGLGGLPSPATGRSELETANLNNLDRLAEESACGLTVPVGAGITPGSGPGHLALFGYDPLKYEVGRGTLEALGIDFDLGPNDLAARGNFCTIAPDGTISDRRAGRIPNELTVELCAKMQKEIQIPGVELFVEPVREHRFVLVIRGDGLDGRLSETDPQREGLAPLTVQPLDKAAGKAAAIANLFIEKASTVLAGQEQANGVLLRGFSKYPDFPALPEVTGMRCGAFAVYPMYRGLAKLVGMTATPGGGTQRSQLDQLREHRDDFDFFFYHFKRADAAGEDGNFHAKVAALEEFDALIPDLIGLGADVMMVAGDHSTPAVLAGHSWHPVPFLIRSPYIRPDEVRRFTEASCRNGSLGIFPAVDVMPTAMANAGRLLKYGA
jgi:2,3-bisphosphoglycerate-independent phosphoglycerate mutase